MNILVVDDEKNIRETLKKLLELEGYEVQIADHALAAQELLADNIFSCILLDLRMPDIDGLELLQWIGDRGLRTPVIMMSAHGEIRDAVLALQTGARDYLVKPFDVDELLIRMKRIIDEHRLHSKMNAALFQNNQYDISSGADHNEVLSGQSRIIEKAAPTDTTILITGESGTGKEVMARNIHNLSKRSGNAFVPVNIGGIPETLLESELFGYEKGAFTGADKLTSGIFEAAEGGTVFLDEIGEMSATLQVKLLRVLQERKIRRLGSPLEISIDVRILAATNRDLEAMVKDGSFREDLFYRLNVVRLSLPPLRERRSEIAGLTSDILRKIARKLGKNEVNIKPEAVQALTGYNFPGNIRELENLLERAAILCDNNEIGTEDLPGVEPAAKTAPGMAHQQTPLGGSRAGMHVSGSILDGTMKDIEKRALTYALEKHNGNRSHAAAQLGISRKTLIAKIRDFGLE